MTADPASLPFDQDISNCLSSKIGDAGLAPAQLDLVCDQASGALVRLKANLAQGGCRGIAQANERGDLAEFAATANRFAEDFADLIVVATGGSNLGATALSALLDPYRPPRRIHFLDNLDAHTFSTLLASVDLAQTGFLAISKSGSTMEVLSQILVCIDALLGTVGEAGIARHVLVISEPGDNPLRQVARRYGFETLDHDPDIGGRYSVLSVVGLLPTMYLGLDAKAVRDGAKAVLDAALATEDARHSAPALGAAIAIGMQRYRGANINVFMPYSDQLVQFSRWYAQLWAESLGKGGLGLTPLRATGPVDQHSLLQLFLDGPNDKLFTVLSCRPDLDGPVIRRNGLAIAATDYLEGRTIAEVVNASYRATAETLIKRRRPTRLFTIKALDERTLGALFMHFMLETVLAADLLGVNPFDQPAVDDGKLLARGYLEQFSIEAT
ncbi:MAG: glucose-6-phosphate isomerase [Proteobacteria bacterium]|nr:glucose-6-phosphate isomerase [Pseudomonadota bacterium]